MLRKLVRNFEDRIRLMRVRDRLDVLGDRFSVSESVRVTPTVFTEALDDLAVEVSLKMKREGLRLRDLQRRMGISPRRSNTISRWLRGVEHDVGVLGAVRVAEAVGIPVRVLCGNEAVLPEPRIIYLPRKRARPAPFIPDGQLALPLEAMA